MERREIRTTNWATHIRSPGNWLACFTHALSWASSSWPCSWMSRNQPWSPTPYSGEFHLTALRRPGTVATMSASRRRPVPCFQPRRVAGAAPYNQRACPRRCPVAARRVRQLFQWFMLGAWACCRRVRGRWVTLTEFFRPGRRLTSHGCEPGSGAGGQLRKKPVSYVKFYGYLAAFVSLSRL